MKFEIKHRYSKAVIFEFECASLRICVETAVKARANLVGANLVDADLARANLAGANLAGADLADANLAGANLASANLVGANLASSDLASANLAGANLASANLVDADLARANLASADLADANLAGANLASANLVGANLAGADLAIKPATKDESIAALDKVREIILDNQACLDMGHWHDNEEWKERTCAEEILCGTTHCLAGWLQVCATDPQVRELSPNVAGAICAPVAAKMFYRNDEQTIEWLRDRKYVADAEEAERRREEHKAKKEAMRALRGSTSGAG